MESELLEEEAEMNPPIVLVILIGVLITLGVFMILTGILLLATHWPLSGISGIFGGASSLYLAHQIDRHIFQEYR
jgi:hypothetical protein